MKKGKRKASKLGKTCEWNLISKSLHPHPLYQQCCRVCCRLIGATQILEQISENEQERLFELERKDQENIQMQKYLEKLMEEDRSKLERKAAEQKLLRVSKPCEHQCTELDTP